MPADRHYRVMLVGADDDRQRLGAMLAAAGQRFSIEGIAPEEVSRTGADAPDVAVLARLPSPLPVARFLRDRYASSQIVFLVAPEGLERFRRTLPFVPNLASAWTVSASAEPNVLRQVLEEAARAARERHAVATMVGRINDRLTGQGPPMQQRHSQLAYSERYLATILTQSPDGFVAVDGSGTVIAFNDAAAILFGPAIAQDQPPAFLDLLPDDQRPPAQEAFRIALAGQVPPRVELRLSEAVDGRRFCELSLAPVQLEPGIIGAVSITARDVSERKRAEAHQRLLINELNHRVKNTLAIVQALAHQSFKGNAPAEDERTRFESRLSALAAAHGLLTRKSWEPVSLADLARETVGAACGVGAERLSASGPEVTVPPQSAVAIAMALHELCTNAIKYGALSNADGTVAVRWRTILSTPAARLRLEWVERGGPRVEVPSRQGFGSRMIKRGLAAELQADVQLNFDPEGVVCIIDAPLPKTAKP